MFDNIQSLELHLLVSEQMRALYNKPGLFVNKQLAIPTPVEEEKQTLSFLDPIHTLNTVHEDTILKPDGDGAPKLGKIIAATKSVYTRKFHYGYEITEKMMQKWQKRVQSLYPTAISPLEQAGAHLRMFFELLEEKRCLTKITTTSEYGSSFSTTISDSTLRLDKDNIDPLDTINPALELISLAAGSRFVMVCTFNTWRKLRKNGTLRAQLGYGGSTGLVPISVFEQEILGGGKIIFADARHATGSGENSAAEIGLSASISRIMGNHIVLAHVAERPETVNPGYAEKTFLIKTYFPEHLMSLDVIPGVFNKKSAVAQMSHSFSFNTPCPESSTSDKIDAGYLIYNAVN